KGKTRPAGAVADDDSWDWRMFGHDAAGQIGDLGRFHDKEALCSYAGLVPRVRESAGKAARGGITRQGLPWMRWIMVEAAQVATRCSPPAKRYYERLLRKKHKHVARVALARKLLIAVYALLHDGVVFDEE